MFTARFFKDAAERIIASFVGAFAAVAYSPIVDQDYTLAWKVGLGAALASALKALAASFQGDPASASLVELGESGPRA